MNILDPKYAVKRLKQEVLTMLLFVFLVIAVIVICLAMTAYVSTIGGGADTYSNVSSAPMYHHDHRIDFSDSW